MRNDTSGLVGAAVVLSTFICAPAARADVPVLGPGLHTGTLTREGRPVIDYAIAVPPTYDHATPVPLVLALHFGVRGGSSRFAGRDLLRFLMAPALAELGAVLVAPDALGGERWSSRRNEEAVMTLVDAVIGAYRIDVKRIVVSGFSMGGAGTWHLAGRYPDRFSAAVPVAARPPGALDSWRVPVFAVHSRQDEVVPIEPTVAAVDELRRRGIRADMVVLDDPTHFETSAHIWGVRQAVEWLRTLWR